jgi:rhodanese-related sulfurtransferase
VARKLNKLGYYEATALEGGFDAWKADYPTESIQAGAVG